MRLLVQMASQKLRSTASQRYSRHSTDLVVAFAPKKTLMLVYLCFY